MVTNTLACYDTVKINSLKIYRIGLEKQLNVGDSAIKPFICHLRFARIR
jgi:hypothetical protein